MGYNDNLKNLKNDVTNGFVTAKLENGNLVIEGSTYKYKDFLKNEYKGTNIHWDKDEKAWKAAVDSFYQGDKDRTEVFFGIEIA